MRRAAPEGFEMTAAPYYNNVEIRGVSNDMFWRWFDSIPAKERDFMNEALNGQDYAWRFRRAVQLYPPGIDGTWKP